MTTIHVKEKVWKKLNSLKDPGQSMSDVIERLLAISEFASDLTVDKYPTSDSDTFDDLLNEFIAVISDESLQMTINKSRNSFARDDT